MTDAELRALVRDAVSRHLGRPAATPVNAAPPMPAAPHAHPPASAWQQHPSHHLYLSLVNADGSCVIEPTVPCDHCGYCKSHGH
jgi:hypothetical protein